ncbi:MAG: hypothetical protein V3V12_01060 [Gammaproteobacteria bacterium]
MFDDNNVAKQISELMLEFRIRLSNSVDYVQDTCNEEESLRYKKAMGKVLGYMIYEIAEPIYDRHPDLRPKDIGGTGNEDE